MYAWVAAYTPRWLVRLTSTSSPCTRLLIATVPFSSTKKQVAGSPSG